MKTLPLIAVAVAAALSVAAAQENAAPPALGILLQTLSRTEDPSAQLNILRGINAALKGKRNLAAPKDWQAIYGKLKASPNDEVRQQAQALAVIFGGGGALEELRKAVADPTLDAEKRKAALDSLISAKDAASIPAMLAMVKEAGPLRRAALHGLAAFDDAQIPPAIIAQYGAYNSDEKREALATLATRPAWARALTAAIDAKTIARADLSTPLARQLQGMNDPEITAWLNKNWGAMRTSSAEKQQLIARYKSFLTPEAFVKADPSRGRALFSQTCAVCHTLFGTGGKIGPELPGAFEDVDYLLQNIIDPNAIIGKDYQQTVVQTKDGQTLVGIVNAEDATTVTLKSLAGPQTVQRSDIASLTVLEVSLMPEGLLMALSDDDVRDLFAYLRRHGQVPVQVTPNNVNDFFNGVDLTRWIPSRPDAWRVENGEVIGRGNADRAEFLTSDMAAGDFRFTAQLKLTGDNAAAEIAFRGQQVDGGFQGSAFGFGNSPLTLLKYNIPSKPEGIPASLTIAPGTWTPCEIIAKGANVRVLLNGKPAFELTNPPGGDRSVFSFQVSGKDAELRLKEVRLELVAKQP